MSSARASSDSQRISVSCIRKGCVEAVIKKTNCAAKNAFNANGSTATQMTNSLAKNAMRLKLNASASTVIQMTNSSAKNDIKLTLNYRESTAYLKLSGPWKILKKLLPGAKESLRTATNDERQVKKVAMRPLY